MTTETTGVERLLARVRELDPDAEYAACQYVDGLCLCPLAAAGIADGINRSELEDADAELGLTDVQDLLADHFGITSEIIGTAASVFDYNRTLDSIIEYLGGLT